MDLYIKGLVAQHWNPLLDKKHIKTTSFKKKTRTLCKTKCGAASNLSEKPI